MANELLMPNMLGAFNQGNAIGQQNRLASLSQQAYGAPETQRNALLGQMEGIKPGAGLEYGQAVQKNDDARVQKLAGAARYLDNARRSGDPAKVQGAWNAVRPWMQREFPQGQFGEKWDDATMAPVLYQALAMGEGAQAKAGQPTGFREFDMTAQAAGLQPGTPGYQEAAQTALGVRGRAASGGFGFKEITGLDGRTRLARTNPRTGALEVYDETTGDFSPLGGAGALNPGSAPAAAPMPAGQESSGTQVVFSDPENIPPQVRAAIEANPDGWGAVPDGATAQIGPQQATAAAAPAPTRAGLGVSQTPAEIEFSKQAAKNQADLANYDAMTEKVTRREAATTAAQAQAKTQAEVSAQRGTRARDANQVLTLLAEAERLIPRATGSAAGALVDTIAGAGGTATEGAKATAQLRTIAGQLTSKMPRMEGPQSNADVEMYKQMAGDLANPSTPREVRLAALRTIRQLNQKYAAQNSAPAPAPAAGTDSGVDDLLGKYGVR